MYCLPIFCPVKALESILRAVLAETESAVVIAVEMQTAATKATHDHTKKLRQVMDSEGEVSIRYPDVGLIMTRCREIDLWEKRNNKYYAMSS